MSTLYGIVGESFPLQDLLVALPELGMSLSSPIEGESDRHKCLALPNGSFLHVFAEEDADSRVSFIRFGFNDVGEAIAAIASHFDVEIVEENDPRFPGCDPREFPPKRLVMPPPDRLGRDV